MHDTGMRIGGIRACQCILLPSFRFFPTLTRFLARFTEKGPIYEIRFVYGFLSGAFRRTGIIWTKPLRPGVDDHPDFDF